MNDDPIGFGIIGIGMVAEIHARALARVPGARLVAAATRDTARGEDFARRHGLPVAALSVRELVARPDIRVVCITTPSGAHLEPALAALAAGKHVVVEKPLEITLERVDLMLDAARAVGLRVVPIFQGRFGDGAQAVYAALRAGRLGRLVLATADVKWHRPSSYYTGWKGTLDLDGGGAVINQAIHGLDLLQWFAGLPVEVSARTARRVHTHIAGEDTAVASVVFPGGALGTITATTAAWPGWARRIELCGESGSVCLEDDRIVRWDFREPLLGDDAMLRGVDGSGLGSGAGAPGAISTVGHERQFADLVAALRIGREPAISGAEGRKAVALVEALYRSAAENCPYHL